MDGACRHAGSSATAKLPAFVYERTPEAAWQPIPRTYRRREPEKTAMYAVVRGQLETFLDEGRRRFESGTGYPAFVENEFLRYLNCGMLSYGFARLRCPTCGFERLVACSCKGRLCPSCWARRAADTAADLVDRVLPEARYRQWVLTFPWELRYHLATDSAFLSQALRVFLRTITAWLRLRGRRAGMKEGQVGALSFLQRFGGILNLNPHIHSIVTDGLFVENPDSADGQLVFCPLPPPTDQDIADLSQRLALRIGILAKRRFQEAGENFHELPVDTLPLRTTVAEALKTPGRRPRRGYLPDILPDDTHSLSPGKDLCARVDGFSLHAARTVQPKDRAELEELCGYGLRAPFSHDRLSLEPDGRVRYRLHRPWPMPGGRTEILLQPLAFMKRLAALLPAPYQNMLRYNGVFANRSRFRDRLPPPPKRADKSGSTLPPKPETIPGSEISGIVTNPPPASAVPLRRRTRLGWAQLLRRVFDISALTCPHCSTPLVVLAFLTDPVVIRKILVHLNLPAVPPTIEPSRLAWPEFGDSDNLVDDGQLPPLLNALSDPHSASAPRAPP